MLALPGRMKVAVVFDTPRAGWEDADFKREVAAHVVDETDKLGEVRPTAPDGER